MPFIAGEYPSSSCYTYLKAKDGSIWFGTKNGLFVAKRKSREFNHYFLKKPKIENSIFYFVLDLLYLEDQDSYLTITNMSQLPQIIDRKTGNVLKTCTLSDNVRKKNNSIDFYKVIKDNDNKIWLSSNKGLYQLNLDNYEIIFPELKTKYDFTKHNLFHLLKDEDENIYISVDNEVALIMINSNRDSVYFINEFLKQTKTDNITDLANMKSGEIIIFAEPKSIVYNPQEKSFKVLSCKTNNCNIENEWIRCGLVNDGIIWFGYRDNGIILLKDWKDEFNITQILKGQGLPSNSVFEFEKDNMGNIWASTGNGLSVIDTKTLKIKNISQNDGLLVNDLGLYWGSALKFLQNGEMFIGGHSFFTIFNPKSILEKETENTNLVFESILVLGEEMDLNKVLNNIEQIDLKYNENSFSISYSNLDYSTISPPEYLYKLEGYDDNWQITSSHFVNYSKIPPGKYRFKLSMAKNKKITKYFDINIVSAWWQTWWFRLIFVIGNIAIIYFIYSKRIAYIKEREKLKAGFDKKLYESEMKMIQSQMNSHFLFNTLNSIKNYIIKNETRLAASYLTSFAQLIRNVLNNSQKELISLASELDTLKLYLKLEMLRFDNKFDYTIVVDNAIDINKTKVPPLLLQPFIENAIWHGLLHKDTKGKIEVSIKKEYGKLIYSIIDNGVGRKKAEEMKSKSALGKKTYGLKLSSERLETFKKMYDFDISMEIIDILDDIHEAKGTKILISFGPKIK